MPLGCVFVQHPEWATMTQSELLGVASQVRARQTQIRAGQGVVEAKQRSIEPPGSAKAIEQWRPPGT
jgi:hypothetical protein